MRNWSIAVSTPSKADEELYILLDDINIDLLKFQEHLKIHIISTAHYLIAFALNFDPVGLYNWSTAALIGNIFINIYSKRVDSSFIISDI